MKAHKKNLLILFSVFGLSLALAAGFADCAVFEKINYHPSWRKSCWKYNPCALQVCGTMSCACKGKMRWNPSDEDIAAAKIKSNSNPIRTGDYDKRMLEAAEKGDAEAQNYIAETFVRENLGDKRDWSTAVKWWRKAANQGHEVAQFHLATAYLAGWGVEKNLDEYASLCLKAANKGDPAGQTCTARNYRDGIGVKKDLVESYFWDELAKSRNSYAGVPYHASIPHELTEQQKQDVLKRVKEWKDLYEQKWIDAQQAKYLGANHPRFKELESQDPD